MHQNNTFNKKKKEYQNKYTDKDGPKNRKILIQQVSSSYCSVSIWLLDMKANTKQMVARA